MATLTRNLPGPRVSVRVSAVPRVQYTPGRVVHTPAVRFCTRNFHASPIRFGFTLTRSLLPYLVWATFTRTCGANATGVHSTARPPLIPAT